MKMIFTALTVALLASSNAFAFDTTIGGITIIDSETGKHITAQEYEQKYKERSDRARMACSNSLDAQNIAHSSWLYNPLMSMCLMGEVSPKFVAEWLPKRKTTIERAMDTCHKMANDRSLVEASDETHLSALPSGYDIYNSFQYELYCIMSELRYR